jgi:hypothetical protein
MKEAERLRYASCDYGPKAMKIDLGSAIRAHPAWKTHTEAKGTQLKLLAQEKQGKAETKSILISITRQKASEG